MRLARTVMVAAGACALTAAAAMSAGSAVAVTAAKAPGAQADVVIRPGVHHAAHASIAPPTTAYCEANYGIACYEPNQIQQAYNLPTLYLRGVNGRHATIVIVDSFGSPTIRQDLAHFDQTFHYPAPPSFNVIQPAGQVPPYDPNNSDMVGWAGETTLDVEYAHTVAPGANILLVETPVSETEGVTGFPQIVTAENYVINHHLGDVISQSFSATEETFPNKATLESLRGAYENAYAHHVTVLTASGDSGAADVGLDESTYYLHPVTSWPDSDPLVTGVGGTQLHLNAAGQHTAPDNVWNDTYNKRDPGVHHRQQHPEPAGRWRRQVHLLQPPALPERRGQRRGRQPRCAGHLDERGLQRGGGHLPELRRADARLVPGVRHQRGDAAVLGHRGPR